MGFAVSMVLVADWMSDLVDWKSDLTQIEGEVFVLL